MSENKAISIVELAENLGVTPAIIRSWQSNLALNVPQNEQQEWIYDKDWQEVFKQIAVLRKVGSSFNKIAEQLKPLLPGSVDSQPPPTKARPVKMKARGDKKKQEPGTPEPTVPPDVRSFIPPTLQADDSVKVVRSNVSEKELLGLYGPPPVQVERSSNELQEPPSQALAPDANAFTKPVQSSGLTAFESLIEERKAMPLVQWTPGKATEELQAIQTHMSQAISDRDIEKVMGSYVRLVESYQALSSRYSESTYRIGQLETEKKMLNENLTQCKAEETEKIDQLKAHVSSLKKMLDTQEHRLDEQTDTMATKDKIEDVEKQLKLLTLTILNEQKEKNKPKGFVARLKALFTRKVL